MDWSRQGGAVISPARLTDGRAVRVVLVADRANPKGAMLIVADSSATQNAFPLSTLLDSLRPNDAADILCMQERMFGASALTVPELS